MMSKEQYKKKKYNMLIWGITITICAFFTYSVELSMLDDSSYAFFLFIGPVFLLIGLTVLLVEVVKALKVGKKDQLLF